MNFAFNLHPEGETAEINRLKQPLIHTLTQVQPYGVLLVLQATDLRILQVSQNAYSLFGIPAEEVLEKTLEELLDVFQVDRIRPNLEARNLEALNPTKVWVRAGGDDYGVFDAVFHLTSDDFLVMELEPALARDPVPFLSFYYLARASIGQLDAAAQLEDFCQVIVQEVRKVTGFDRIMLYRFNEDGHGEVVAEDKVDEMDTYLGLHFPESDIPRPARKLFLSNWIRIIPDAQTTPVSLYPPANPLSHQPVDLTLSILRSPHDCHREYLKNMGIRASLTISLMKDGKLWGLIACHHRTPKFVPYELRKACEFLGRLIFAEISTREEEADHDYQLKLTQVQSMLIERMSKAEHFVEGLIQGEPNVLNLVNAQGAAICLGGHWTTVGSTPPEAELNYLLQWLAKSEAAQTGELFHTDSLPRLYSESERFKHIASGLLAIPIAKQSYVIWFRPEVLQSVNWGGDPNEAYELYQSEGDLCLCPRKSFDLWKETVRLQSLPWKPVEIAAALELRKAIVNIVLRQAEELALLAQDLQRSNAELKKFAYVASHDLQEPLNQVANFVQLLEMRYNAKLDQDAKEFIGFAVDGVSLMQTLIDDVLAYSKVDLQGIKWELTDVNEALQRALNNLGRRVEETQAQIICGPMPSIVSESTQLMQLFQNLIGNAIKFRQSDEPPCIQIRAERQEEVWQFSVQDNGIGLEAQFADRIFVIFQRLHTRDEYPGSGMGLAICKKIVECHRGQIWVESELGQGSTFYFTIPVGGRDRQHGHEHRTKNYLFS